MQDQSQTGQSIEPFLEGDPQQMEFREWNKRSRGGRQERETIKFVREQAVRYADETSSLDKTPALLGYKELRKRICKSNDELPNTAFVYDPGPGVRGPSRTPAEGDWFPNPGNLIRHGIKLEEEAPHDDVVVYLGTSWRYRTPAGGNAGDQAVSTGDDSDESEPPPPPPPQTSLTPGTQHQKPQDCKVWLFRLIPKSGWEEAKRHAAEAEREEAQRKAATTATAGAGGAGGGAAAAGARESKGESAKGGAGAQQIEHKRKRQKTTHDVNKYPAICITLPFEPNRSDESCAGNQWPSERDVEEFTKQLERKTRTSRQAWEPAQTREVKKIFMDKMQEAIRQGEEVAESRRPDVLKKVLDGHGLDVLSEEVQSTLGYVSSIASSGVSSSLA